MTQQPGDVLNAVTLQQATEKTLKSQIRRPEKEGLRGHMAKVHVSKGYC